MESLWTDVRFALHLMRARQAYALGAILTLALGIGLTSALISVIDAAWLRPLPFPHPERIVKVQLTLDHQGDTRTLAPSLTDLRVMREASHVVAAIGEWHAWEQRQVLDTGEPERAKVLRMSEGYIETYGIGPHIGRTFAEFDNRAGAPMVLLLGHAYWQRRFNSDPEILGRTVQLDNTTATIVGVLPPGFHRNAQMWQPEMRTPTEAGQRGTGADVYARLPPGVSRDSAQAALTDIARQWSSSPGDRVIGVTLSPVYDDLVEGTRRIVSVISAGVGLLMLLVCVNVGGLLLANGADRVRELAVRASMGAGRARLVRQLLTEGGVLGAIACVIGLAIGWWSLESLVSLLPLDLPPHVAPAMNRLVVAGTIAATLVTVLAVSLWPAWRLTRASIGELVAGAGRRSALPWRRRTGPSLMAVEVALAVVLLTASGLLLRSLNRLLAVDLGFDPEAVLVLEASPVSGATSVWAEYYPALLERLRALPGVEAAGATDSPPLGDTGMVVGGLDHGNLTVYVNAPSVSPGFFEAYGFRVLDGRTFRDDDRGQGVVVINEAAARRLFPGQRAVGQSISFPAASTIVGVVSNIRQSGGRFDVTETIYSWLEPDPRMPPAVAIRATGVGPGLDAIRQAALSAGPRALVERIQPGTALLRNTVARPRHRTMLVGLLGVLGLMLTLIGTAGIMAYSVTRRTQEIGVRMACGADGRSVVRTLMRDAAWPVAVGAGLGAAASLYAVRLVESFLFETPPADPATFAVVALVIVTSTLLAAWIPARAASRVDPVAALRE